jgi:two-component system, NtrC family, sensor kinase
MLLAGEPIGAITVGWAEPRAYKDQQITLLQTFADQAVIAIENVRLFNETREALERQTATADILKVIASSPSDVQPVFEAIAASANRLIGGFSTAVLRFIGEDLHLAAFTPTNPNADEALKASFPRPLSEFPAFVLVRDGETVEFTDTEVEDVPQLIRDMARLRGYRSMLFTPLISAGAQIGLISVTRKAPGSFAAHHVQLVRTFADQAVIAIENVRLFDQVQERTRDLSESLQQQTATADVLKVISRSTFDLKAVLTTLIQSARELCSAQRGVVLLRDKDVYRPAMQLGYPPEFERYIVDHPVLPNRSSGAGRAAFTGQVAHFPDVLADPEYQLDEGQRLGGYRALLSIPLLREGEVVGVFSLGRTEPAPFSERQIELVQTFADQAVIAIENVRLFEQVQARTAELSASLDELRAAQDRLVQTEKLASLGQLTAGIAHEIKNPLNFVNNFSGLSAELTDELNDVLKAATLSGRVREEVEELTRMLKENLEKVVQHGKRADSIVKNMLLHSREGSGEHRRADINALLDESLNLAYHGARAEKAQFNVTLRRDFDDTAGTLELFPQEITRVFLNLISNGFYALGKRNSQNSEQPFEPLLSAATRNLGDAVEIRIRDNGTGIPPEVKEKMFNPFFTTKPAGEGTGLGLSMSYDIVVKQHGGSIDVETKPGQFTEFRIVLPRTSSTPGKN